MAIGTSTACRTSSERVDGDEVEVDHLSPELFYAEPGPLCRVVEDLPVVHLYGLGERYLRPVEHVEGYDGLMGRLVVEVVEGWSYLAADDNLASPSAPFGFGAADLDLHDFARVFLQRDLGLSL